MSVRAYLKRNISDYFSAVAFVLAVSFVLSQSSAQMISVQESAPVPVIILDPGHGGTDGGTKTGDGVLESGINLEISRRLSDLFGLMGIECIMTRDSDVSLDTEGSSIREKKNSDLRNRVKVVNETENGLLISIHQNHFSQSQYSGPQVFYAQTDSSEEFAQLMQSAMNTALAPNSNRICKSAKGVYLMEHIQKPGILIECGFLSNPSEAEKLQSGSYQKKLAEVIACAAAQFILRSAVG